MIVDFTIKYMCESSINGIPQVMLDKIRDSLNSIRSWGERINGLVDDGVVDGVVHWVYDVDGVPVTRFVEAKIWPLEKYNFKSLSILDRRIIELYIDLKKHGVCKPSVVSYVLYEKMLYERDAIDSYDNNYIKWVGANLVLSRLRGNARLAVRYDDFEKFGNVFERKENWTICYMDNSCLKPELIKRGLLRV